MKADIFDIYKGTTNDGPGIHDTVFFKGCPLSCRWCHNPEGIDIKNRMWYEERSCIGCGICEKVCQSGAVKLTDDGVILSRNLCVMCGCCAEVCPTESIKPICKGVHHRRAFT
ncbi:MAG: 4Fe-4S binding protein [Clostridia bacterium]|nr:4Fe-4S binding protein [Clostridia bacterium]